MEQDVCQSLMTLIRPLVKEAGLGVFVNEEGNPEIFVRSIEMGMPISIIKLSHKDNNIHIRPVVCEKFEPSEISLSRPDFVEALRNIISGLRKRHDIALTKMIQVFEEVAERRPELMEALRSKCEGRGT